MTRRKSGRVDSRSAIPAALTSLLCRCIAKVLINVSRAKSRTDYTRRATTPECGFRTALVKTAFFRPSRLLENKIGFHGLAWLHRHLSLLCPERRCPCAQRELAGWNSLNDKLAVIARDREERIAGDADVGFHPGMLVAIGEDHDFRVRNFILKRRGLALEGDAAGNLSDGRRLGPGRRNSRGSRSLPGGSTQAYRDQQARDGKHFLGSHSLNLSGLSRA